MHYFARMFLHFFVLFALIALPAPLLAQNIEGDIELPASCTVVDKSGSSHTFPKEDSPGTHLAVCALAKAIEAGLIDSVRFDEFPGFGLFVEGLDGIVAGADEFWALWLNGEFADCGVECLVLTEGDTVSLILSSFEGEERGASVVLHITALVQTPGATFSSGGGEYLQDRPFDIPAAIAFLVEMQDANGAFGSAMLTDWAAIAFGAAGSDVCDDACREARDRLRAYLIADPATTSPATSLERRIMALEALGIDPHTTTVSTTPSSPTIVEALAATFDGRQIGDPNLVNDDIFALFPLIHAGFAKDDPMIESIVAYIFTKQRANGSWEESIDLTAAAIQALTLFSHREDIPERIAKAEEFLRRSQDNSGTFGSNGFSLGWMLQAIAALDQTPDDWRKSGVAPLGYLGILQQADGGVEPMSRGNDMRIWATAYAIPGALAKPWSSILRTFLRPKPIESVAAPAAASVPAPAPQVAFKEQPLPESPRRSTTSPRETTAPDPAPSTTTAPTTLPAAALAAAAAEGTSERNDLWLWLSGFALIALALSFVFFFRRA